jgi:putative protease
MDQAVISSANRAGLSVHISTQANISNLESVRFYAGYADVMVLARELSLEQISSICHRIEKEAITGPGGRLVAVELFIHGAMCVSIAGKCHMSLMTSGKSANRGDCLQNCRRRYRVLDDSSGDELILDNEYIMSPKDLCTIRYMDKLIESGASVFKIEGRGRSVDYVYRVTGAYRSAIDSVMDGRFSAESAAAMEKELETVFNRGFWHGGYYLGHPMGEWSGKYGSHATKKKAYVGYVINYYKKAGIVHLQVEDTAICPGDTVFATGHTTGYAEARIESIYYEDRPVETAVKGMRVTIPFAEQVRRNDKIYRLSDR